ncbi:MAG TPA: fumarylacetoacetate hydrolase family protein [Kineosporiaceae bacterium]|nr:fumarylacetoacetate hydrolase family protein [Kineosporiaceae bacterium]
MTAVWRVDTAQGPRLALGEVGDGPAVLLAPGLRVTDLLRPGGWEQLAELGRDGEPVQPGARVLAPVDDQEVWAAGVTYVRSRDARLEESGRLDAYDQVYVAERPELFWKAGPGEARGPGETVGIRADSGWDVPEPELAVIADGAGRIVAACVGNDMSSRSIEGENPLYLPQAKVYRHSVALGPALVGWAGLPDPPSGEVTLAITRGGRVVVQDAAALSELHRRPDDLLGWLFRARDFPRGVVLLTGTGVVPSPDFTLAAGDQVRISITGLGELVNVVEVVGSR